MTNLAKVRVGRFDNDKLVEVDETLKVNQVFNLAGYNKATNEEIQTLAGDVLTGDEDIEAGQSYYLVQRVKSN